MDKFKGAIFDIDGVLVYQGQVYPDAIETINILRARGVKLRFLTNSTLKSRASATARLRQQGFEVYEDEMFTASSSTANYLHHVNAKSVWVLQAGAGLSEFSSLIRDNQNPEYVVIGDNRDGLNFANLNKALQLVSQGATLIGMSPELIDHSLGKLELNVGSWTGMIEKAARVQAVYIGKPNPYGFQLVLKTMALAVEQVVMVGDLVHSDIKGAHSVGIKSILLKTGEFRPRHLQNDEQPDYCYQKINEILELF